MFLQKRNFQHYLFLIIIISFLISTSSCSENKDTVSNTETEKEEATSNSNPAPIPQNNIVKEYLELKTEVEISWQDLEKLEAEKYFTMERLLKEVTYNPQHSPKRVEEELEKINRLKEQQLTQASLENLDNMDNYDQLSDQVVRSILTLKNETPGMEGYPLVEELISDLDSLNGETVMKFRGYYGDAVLSHNRFIKNNKEVLTENGYTDIKAVYGLFPEEDPIEE